MCYIVLCTILTKYLRDVPHLSNHQNVLPSTLQKRNAFSFQDTRVQMYVYVYVQSDARVCVCALVRRYASVCVCMCMYACNKGQRKGSVYSSYWRPRRSMRVGCLSTLTIRTLTHRGTITTHTRAVKYHGRVCLSYFSPWTQVYNHLCRFTWHFHVFHFVCYIIYVCYFIYPYATSSCRRRAGEIEDGDRET